MELKSLKKNLSCSDTHEPRKLVDHDHSELSVSWGCAAPVLPADTAMGFMARIQLGGAPCSSLLTTSFKTLLQFASNMKF
jgi:hypothetical protein